MIMSSSLTELVAKTVTIEPSKSVTPGVVNVGPGVAKIKSEFLIPHTNSQREKIVTLDVVAGSSEPEVKRLKISGTNEERDGDDDDNDNELVESGGGANTKEEDGSAARKKKKDKPRGQNKPKDRPRPPKFLNENKLCPNMLDGKGSCSWGSNCQFMHDVDKYLASKTDSIEGECYVYKTYGKCSRGLTCLYRASHTDSEHLNMVNQPLWSEMQTEYETTHKFLLPKDKQIALRKRTFDFKEIEKIYSGNSNSTPKSAELNGGTTKTLGAVTDADLVPLRVSEIKKIDWKDKLYLSPLTTVGNLPFRRLCVEMGADITCSEMSMATSILQGNMHEFALHRRHPSEKLWGVQLCASNGVVCAKAAHTLMECGIDYDFVDLNMGCPLDPIYKHGAGSGLMCRGNKFHSLVKGMTKVLAAKDKAFTVKMRTGIKMDKNIAHSYVEFCRDNGVSAVTLHGRTREQRYLRHADWNYIGTCAKVAGPMPLFGNGDVMSWDDYVQRKTISNASGVMIGRGALIKPWVFQEIKEQRDIDMTSSQRLELIRKYVNYGLDHWGSDSQGVGATRKFLLEWLSFYHRYIPLGILEDPPQRINQRPEKYFGRDEMETLLASSNCNDWVKISEMFLGKVPDFFEFAPKHKANAWSNG